MSNSDVQLETGSESGWEVEKAEGELKSVAESHVLAFSLQRSREKWLTSMLPKFFGKVRKSSKVESDTNFSAPPPHNLLLRGKCEVQIGPHIFLNTTFYEAIYLSASSSSQAPNSTHAGLSTTSFAPSALEPTMATPALIDQINAAAATNPILASLLKLASAGQATQEQLQMLSITVRSLAANPIPASQYNQSNAQSITTSTVPDSTKEFDVVIAFKEAANVRFVIPRGTTVCQRVGPGFDNSFDIVVTSHLQLQSNNSALGELQSSNKLRMFRMTLRGASEALWNTLHRWTGGEEIMKANKEILNKLKARQPRKTYLAYRLPEGPILDQIKAATSAHYPMKALKPPASIKSRRIRKAVPLKVPPALGTSHSSSELESTPKLPQKRSNTELRENFDAATGLAAVITGAGHSANYNLTQSTHHSTLSTAVTSAGAVPPPPKKPRQRTWKSENQVLPAITEIKCRSCQATDVPLMLGGRFCRPCVEAGRGITEIPQLPTYGSPAPSTYTPKYIPPPPPSTNTYLALMNPVAHHASTTIARPRSDAVASFVVSHVPDTISEPAESKSSETGMPSFPTE